MNAPDWPTQYELCRIAASLPGVDTVNKPIRAVKAALGLWLAAGFELSKAKERSFWGNTEAYGRPSDTNGDGQADLSLDEYVEFYELYEEVRKPAADQKPIPFGESEDTSEAMKWVNANATSKKEGFKTFHQFKKSWDEFFGGEAAKYRHACCEAVLQLFLKARRKKRRDADAARKRKERQ